MQHNELGVKVIKIGNMTVVGYQPNPRPNSQSKGKPPKKP